MIYDINIKNIDLNLLKQQKEILLKLQWKTSKTGEPIVSSKEFETLEAIINLIDHVQDQAVDQHNLDENEVFNFNKEE